MELILQIVCLIGCGVAIGLLPALRTGYEGASNNDKVFFTIVYFIIGLMVSAYPIFY